MTDEGLLSTLRLVEPEPEPSHEAQVLERLAFLCNLLEDLKLKQSITNELLLEIAAQGKSRTGSDFASQARPIQNKFSPRPVRRGI